MRYRQDVFDDKYARVRPDQPCKPSSPTLQRTGTATSTRSRSVRSPSVRPLVYSRSTMATCSAVPLGPVGPDRKRCPTCAGRGDRKKLPGHHQKTEETMTAIQSGSMAFKPRARLLKLIGAELISDDVVAMTELVKNAHDADASSVASVGHGPSDEGVIVIRDDGDGMSLDTLLGRWMEPAASSNSRKGTSALTRDVGCWGEGRRTFRRRQARSRARAHLASARREDRESGPSSTGTASRTRPSCSQTSRINGRSDARSRSSRTAPSCRFPGSPSVWTERMFRRLSARLSRLRSPFAGVMVPDPPAI